VADPAHGAVGAAHMGWRGASLKVAETLVKSMSAEPSRLWVGLSMCLGPDHLELSAEQYPLFAGQACAGPLLGGHFKLDLWASALAQLEACGVAPSQVEIQRDCTACHLDRFYSYRAEAGNCGRMMSCISL
jgi:copper oxidase (laccase) domain-containing protein